MLGTQLLMPSVFGSTVFSANCAIQPGLTESKIKFSALEQLSLCIVYEIIDNKMILFEVNYH